MAVIQAPARLVPEINLCHLGRAYDIKDLIADVDFFLYTVPEDDCFIRMIA